MHVGKAVSLWLNLALNVEANSFLIKKILSKISYSPSTREILEKSDSQDKLITNDYWY